jgi:hypothetical protein
MADKTILILPNPNKGEFKILTSVESDAVIPIKLFTTDGKLVHEETLIPANKKLDATIDVRGKLASGVYRLKTLVDGKKATYSIVIQY